jgi:ribosomal protein S18 acetylase RimI-like enzyme
LRKYKSVNFEFKALKKENFMIFRKKRKFSAINTKLAENKHFEKCYELKKAFEEEYWGYILNEEDEINTKKIVEEKLNEKNVIIYERNSEILGIGFIEIETSKTCLIGSVYVLPKYRGLKIGQNITKALINSIIDREKIPILTVASENAPAISVYLKLGFKKIGDVELIEF